MSSYLIHKSINIVKKILVFCDVLRYPNLVLGKLCLIRTIHIVIVDYDARYVITYNILS